MSKPTKTTQEKPKSHTLKNQPKTHAKLNATMNSPMRNILNLHQTVGNQAVQSMFESGFIQGKLTVGEPNDKYEQEADRVADEVMRMPEPQVQRQSEEDEEEEMIQTKPIGEKITPLVQRQVEPEEEEEETIQTKYEGQTPHVTSNLESRVNALQGSGQPLSKETRNFFEPRFGTDFSKVKIHTDSNANQLARSINAKAFTRGSDVVFAGGEYSPESSSGKRLLGHELTHVVQQKQSINFVQSNNLLQMRCLTSAVCGGPIPGSPEEFDRSETAREIGPRARRARMSPRRQRSTGHAGHARQLETFLNVLSPGLLGNIHGIYIDRDMSSNTAGYISACNSLTPPITGASKPCMFVPAIKNRQAYIYNHKRRVTTIGGQSRKEWKIETLQLLTHEIQHVVFDSASHARSTIGTCSRSDVNYSLSELSAMMSEFPIVYRAIPRGAALTHPSRIHLRNWFQWTITNSGESIKGALTSLRCEASCNCTDIDTFVRDTFNFTTSSWTPTEKTTLNTELRKPHWHLNWPL